MLSKQAEIEIKEMLLQGPPLYLGLFDGEPDEFGEGADEIDYAGYERQLIEFDGTVSEHAKGNTNTIEIVRPPEGFEARAITHIGLWNAETGGELRLFATLTRNNQPYAQPLGHNSTFKIGANSAQFDFVNVKNPADCNG